MTSFTIWERQVIVELLKDGAENKILAARLNSTESKVKTAIKSISRKLQVNTRAKILLKLIKTPNQENFREIDFLTLSAFQKRCHEHGFSAGWWDDLDPDNLLTIATKISLIHSEISEALEGFRKDLMDSHLPHRKAGEVELADAVIRIFDLAGAKGYNLQETILEKDFYNQNRLDHKREVRAAKDGKKI